MEKNLREPLIGLLLGESPVEMLDDVMTDEMPEVKNSPETEGGYGILADYYEIFGEMEDLVR